MENFQSVDLYGKRVDVFASLLLALEQGFVKDIEQAYKRMCSHKQASLVHVDIPVPPIIKGLVLVAFEHDNV